MIRIKKLSERTIRVNEEVSPTAEFMIPEPYKSGFPNPTNLSKIRVSIDGMSSKWLSIAEFFKVAADKHSPYYNDVNAIIATLKKSMKDLAFEGNLAEFIFVYFAEYKGSMDPLDVVVRNGIPVDGGRGSTAIGGHTQVDTKEVKGAEVPIYNPIFKQAVSRTEVLDAFRQYQAIGIMNPVPGQRLPSKPTIGGIPIGTYPGSGYGADGTLIFPRRIASSIQRRARRALESTIIHESVDTGPAIAQELEKAFYQVFPHSRIHATFNTVLSASISSGFTLGKDRDEWHHGIDRNDILSGVVNVEGFKKDGSLLIPGQVKVTFQGSILTKSTDPYKALGLVKWGVRSGFVPVDKLQATFLKAFKTLKDKIVANKAILAPTLFDINSKL